MDSTDQTGFLKESYQSLESINIGKRITLCTMINATYAAQHIDLYLHLF